MAKVITHPNAESTEHFALHTSSLSRKRDELIGARDRLDRLKCPTDYLAYVLNREHLNQLVLLLNAIVKVYGDLPVYTWRKDGARIVEVADACELPCRIQS